MLNQTADRESAFYEFFRLHLLQPLSADELIVCLRQLALGARRKGRAGRADFGRRTRGLRALHAFTGGNPRVLALIYRLLETETTDASLRRPRGLLDQTLRPLQGPDRRIPDGLQRKVIDALALNWDPITSPDLAASDGDRGDDHFLAARAPAQRRAHRRGRARRRARRLPDGRAFLQHLVPDAPRHPPHPQPVLLADPVPRLVDPADNLPRMAEERSPAGARRADRTTTGRRSTARSSSSRADGARRERRARRRWSPASPTRDRKRRSNGCGPRRDDCKARRVRTARGSGRARPGAGQQGGRAGRSAARRTPSPPTARSSRASARRPSRRCANWSQARS